MRPPRPDRPTLAVGAALLVLLLVAGAVAATGAPRPALGRVAFVRGGDLWTKELPDGAERRLTDDGRNHTPLWSASGEWLAFRKELDVGKDGASRPWEELWAVHRSGAHAHPVDRVEPALGQEAGWSPNGDRLAYSARGALVTVNADGTDRRQLAPAPGDPDGGVVTSVAWSPDGRWIAFDRLAQRPPGAQGLWRVRADGGELHAVYRPPNPALTPVHLAGWAPDGRALLFWGRYQSASLTADGVPLMRVPADGGPPEQVTRAMLAYADFLAWAPDGQRLALVDGAGRFTWDGKAIAVVPPAGGLVRLPARGRADLAPAWSPDGRWIAFASAASIPNDAGANIPKLVAGRRVWVMAADGATRRQLADAPGARDERPQWSADGRFVLFARFQGERAQLWLVRADGTDPRPVVEELSPSPWRGNYYGHVEWGRAYAWWASRR